MLLLYELLPLPSENEPELAVRVVVPPQNAVAPTEV